jgi:hypothetical protein
VLSGFTGACLRHFGFEERHVWPRLRAALPPRAVADLDRKVRLARQAGLGNPLRIS